MCGWQVKLCDPLVTRGPYLSALEIRSLYIKRYINSPFLLLLCFFTYLLTYKARMTATEIVVDLGRDLTTFLRNLTYRSVAWHCWLHEQFLK